MIALVTTLDISLLDDHYGTHLGKFKLLFDGIHG